MQLFWDIAILIMFISLLLVRQAGAEVTVLSLFVLRGVGDRRMLLTARPARWEHASLPGAVSLLGIDCRCQDQRGNNETGVKSFIL